MIERWIYLWGDVELIKKTNKIESVQTVQRKQCRNMGAIYRALHTQEEVFPSSALCGLCWNLRLPVLPDICLVKMIIQVKIYKPSKTMMSRMMYFSDPQKYIFPQIFSTSLQTHLTSFSVSSHLRTSPSPLRWIKWRQLNCLCSSSVPSETEECLFRRQNVLSLETRASCCPSEGDCVFLEARSPCLSSWFSSLR